MSSVKASEFLQNYQSQYIHSKINHQICTILYLITNITITEKYIKL